jgi:hypothetical protein
VKSDANSLAVLTKLGVSGIDSYPEASTLIDSGATWQFLDTEFIWSHNLPTIKLPTPIKVYNVDGMENWDRAITEVVDATLFIWNHSECTLFAVMNLGNQQMILGHQWLSDHNPEINWVTGDINF